MDLNLRGRTVLITGASKGIGAAAARRFGDEGRYRELMANYPLGRPAKPREIADLMAFLASDRSAYTTGVVFTVDGGISASPG